MGRGGGASATRAQQREERGSRDEGWGGGGKYEGDDDWIGVDVSPPGINGPTATLIKITEKCF